MKHPNSRSASCRCGAFALRAEGPPIVTVACYCKSCQAAAVALTAGERGSLLEADGGTLCTLFRKDRVSWASSALREHRLTPNSKTRRVVATCCDTPMFMEFTEGHWLSLYTRRFPSRDQPPLETRTMTRDAPAGTRFTDDVPAPAGHSLGFFARLLWAWARMGFRAPTLDLTRSTHDAA